jgi:DnaK suppressor protein
MDKAKMEKFKRILINLRSQVLNGALLKSREELHVPPEDLADETDLASSIIHQNVSVNIQQREFQKLRDIEDALMRIDDGTYGHCEECDEEIGDKRLTTHPWTTLCISHAEEREREGIHYTKASNG